MKKVFYNYDKTFFLFHNIFFYIQPAFVFFFSGRFLCRSRLYCCFFSFCSLERLWHLSWDFFLKFLFNILVIFSWGIFISFSYIWKKNDKNKLIKKFDLLEDIVMLQEFYTLFNSSFIIIYIIHKVSVSPEITLIVIKIVFSNVF